MGYCYILLLSCSIAICALGSPGLLSSCFMVPIQIPLHIIINTHNIIPFCLSFCLSFFLSFCLSVFLSFCLSVFLSFYIYNSHLIYNTILHVQFYRYSGTGGDGYTEGALGRDGLPQGQAVRDEDFMDATGGDRVREVNQSIVAP